MIWGAFTLLLTGLIILIFISAALAPLESLGWYAGWQAKEGEPDPAAGRNSWPPASRRPIITWSTSPASAPSRPTRCHKRSCRSSKG
jgi:hypothetical protein